MSDLAIIGTPRPTILVHGKRYGLIFPQEGVKADREALLSMVDRWSKIQGDITNVDEAQLEHLITDSRHTVKALVPEIEPYVLRGLTFVEMMQIWNAWASHFGESSTDIDV